MDIVQDFRSLQIEQKSQNFTSRSKSISNKTHSKSKSLSRQEVRAKIAPNIFWARHLIFDTGVNLTHPSYKGLYPRNGKGLRKLHDNDYKIVV
jgi:hypothetical protein